MTTPPIGSSATLTTPPTSTAPQRPEASPKGLAGTPSTMSSSQPEQSSTSFCDYIGRCIASLIEGVRSWLATLLFCESWFETTTEPAQETQPGSGATEDPVDVADKEHLEFIKITLRTVPLEALQVALDHFKNIQSPHMKWVAFNFVLYNANVTDHLATLFYNRLSTEMQQNFKDQLVIAHKNSTGIRYSNTEIWVNLEIGHNIRGVLAKQAVASLVLDTQ
jgi:hypothetical protein